MIEISGDYLEGGGQILRTAVALSAVTGKACRITNIRKGRPNPGLQAQHLEGINATARLCNAEISGNKLGSTEIIFQPHEIQSGALKISIPTAGSVGLVLQPLMIAAIHAGSAVEINISGGATNGKWAPPTNYIIHVLLPLLEKMGYKGSVKIEKYGYYPKGGAQVRAMIEPSDLKSLWLIERGQLLGIDGISHASVQLENAKVAERQAKAAENILKRDLEIAPMITINYVRAENLGSALELFAKTENSVLGSDALGEIRKRAEEVGKEAAEHVVKTILKNSAVDRHAEDQLLPYMALAEGKSAINVADITNHTRTNIWVIEKFLPVKFEIDEKEKIIYCKPL
jgi:RNA 3'-terminal phosphate cyclase (ATP)/RNA 3'-terminal phosphate cyclase (GTP)